MNARTDRLVAGTAAVLLTWGSLVCAGPYHFAGGTGEPNDPYQIATAEQLFSLGSDPNLLDKHFVLLNDIDLDPNLPGGRVFTKAIIAPNAYEKGPFQGIPFTGSFDGRGHSVCHLMSRADGAGYLGLFGCIGKQGVVRDLGIAGVDVNGGHDCGALAGISEGSIRRCHGQARVSAGSYAGGLVGYNDGGEIIDCWAEGEVTAGESVGGLVGESWGTILNSYTSSRVISRWSANQGGFGGLLGWNWGHIVNCCATGDVSALTLMENGGGLVGINYGHVLNCRATGSVSATRGVYLGGVAGENTGFIVHSCATGNVSGGTSAHGTRDGKPAGSQELGGLVGRNSGGYIYACCASGDVSGGDGSSNLGGLLGVHGLRGEVVDSYCVGQVRGGANSTGVGALAGSGSGGIRASFWDREASGLAESRGGTGLATAQMQDAATFLAAGWDWVGERANGPIDPWFIPEGGGYPQLTFLSDAFQPHALDGSGTAGDPYRIAAVEDLAALNHCDLTGCYRLEADVNLAGIIWKEPPLAYFNGQFDGAGRTVFNLRVQGDSSWGLFGILDRSASVVNLGIRAANIMGTGGMLADRNKGRIAGCGAHGAVSGVDGVGGLVYWNEGRISDSYAVGEVTAIASTGVGGLTGVNLGSINRCYAGAHVTSTVPVPGYVSVTGGLVGDSNRYSFAYPPGQVYESYFLIDIDGGGPDNGLGTALTDAQMKQQASFPGWDFDATWTICEGRDYPRLRWENIQCEE